jgi:hypothetical protein
MERVVQRADDVARAGEASKYAFEKHSISEELDTLPRIPVFFLGLQR